MSQDPNQPNKSGGMSTLMIVLIVFGVLFLVCAGACGGCIVIGGRAASNAANQFTEAVVLLEPSSIAQGSIQGNEEVTSKYGTPVNFGPATREGDTKGELNLADTRFAMTVEGNGNKGTAHVKAKQIDGQWAITEITVKDADGSVINVPVSGEAAPPDIKFEDGTEEMPEEDKK